MVVAALVLVGGGDDGDKTTATTTRATPAGANKPAPAVASIQITKSAPVGDVKTIAVKKGERVVQIAELKVEP